MIYVGVRDLKAKLSEYLDKAQLGDEVVVTEYGKPIVRLIKEPVRDKSTIEKLYSLAEKGSVELPLSKIRKNNFKPIKLDSSISASDILLQSR
jgi:prevent-host-death family protein